MNAALALVLAIAVAAPALAQNNAVSPRATQGTTSSQAKPAASPVDKAATATIEPPAGYLIGIEDVLTVDVWREKDLSAEAVVVGPDGTISLPVINQVTVAGLTLDAAANRIKEAFVKAEIIDPTVSVGPKAINSRKVFITGQIAKSAYYPLIGPMTVLQLIATAGGTLEYADEKNIKITRTERGQQVQFTFNYKDFKKGKGLDKNIELKPGDTVTVP
jgi:polysaccharide export outer membrane protein